MADPGSPHSPPRRPAAGERGDKGDLLVAGEAGLWGMRGVGREGVEESGEIVSTRPRAGGGLRGVAEGGGGVHRSGPSVGRGTGGFMACGGL